jgi:DNA replication licensing factor MCM2
MMQGGNEYDYEEGQEMNGLEDINDYSEPKGPISQWIQRNEVKLFIRKKFGNFLRTFKDKSEHHVYEERIHAMCQHNKQSIEVNFTHLSNKQPTLAIWLAEEPAIMLPILNEVANDTVLEVYPDYSNIHDQVFVRVRDLPVEDKLRDLRQVHLNALIKFKGVVTKRTGVFPQFSKMYFRCICGDLKGPTYHNNVFEGKQYLGKCILCQKDGPYTLD